MRALPRVLISVVTACLLLPAVARAQAHFYGVGDLPGGPSASLIRDATKVGGVIYAVGGGAANPQCLGAPPCNAVYTSDTGMLWTWNGVTAATTALPNLVTNTTATNAAFALAITPDAAYIASQARSVTSGGLRLAVRVTRSGLVNLNLTPGAAMNSVAAAISNDGTVLYGQINNSSQAVRFDAAGPTTTNIPQLPGTTFNAPANRGTSTDGSIMVGTSYNAGYVGSIGGLAFRYVHGVGVSAIPLLAGGTWNKSIALAPSGSLALIGGNSTSSPNGEAYLYNSTSGTTTSLGSPNWPWTPSGAGGMTADGSVVAMSFVATNGNRFAYFKNSSGWYHLASALLAGAGVDLVLSDWDPTTMQVMGMSPDGTLVYGFGTHSGNQEGWVAEFPAGYLANFRIPAVTPSNSSIVGAWHFVNDLDAADDFIIAMLADGNYIYIQKGIEDGGSIPGYEVGRYTWNSATGALRLETLKDTSGSGGTSGASGYTGIHLTVSGSTATLDPGGETFTGTKITGGPGSIVGGWLAGNPQLDDQLIVFIFLGDNTFYFAQDDNPLVSTMGNDGIEYGTYTWNPITGAGTATASVDTNGNWGASPPGPPGVIRPSADGSALFLIDSGETFQLTAIAGVPRVPGLNFNGDTAGDVFTLSTSTGAWAVQNTTSSGGFTAANGAWAPGWTVTPARFNGDALTDVFLFNPTSGQWFKMLNDGAGGWTVEGFAAWGTNWQRFVVDLNGDGLSDLFLWDPTLGTWFKCIASAGGFTYTQGFWSLGWEVYPMHLNADAFADFFIFNRTNGQWFWVTGDAGGGFSYPQFAAWSPVWQFYPGDYNTDGLDDLVLHNPANGQFFVATNTGTNFTYVFGTFAVGYGLYPIDLNTDRATDLFLHNPATGQWFEMRSNYNGTFGTIASGIWALGFNLYATDFDADGRGDFLLYNPATGQWFQARNAIGGGFTYTAGVWAPGLTITATTPGAH